MSTVRLATRSVIAAFAKPEQIAQVLLAIHQTGAQMVDVSVLGLPSVLNQPIVVPGKRILGIFGNGALTTGPIRAIAREGTGDIHATGPVGEALASSPILSVTGALVMQGIPQREAHTYADLIRTGKIVILAGVADHVVGQRVQEVFSRNHGEAIVYHAGRPYGTAFHGSGPGLR